MKRVIRTLDFGFVVVSLVMVTCLARSVMTGPGTLRGGIRYACGINDIGQVAGYSEAAGSYPPHHAFLSCGGTMTDAGIIRGDDSVAYGVNNAGHVAGWDCTAGDMEHGYSHAFLYSGGIMNDLGTLGGSWSESQAYGIGNSGQGEGRSCIPVNMPHALLYPGGAMTAPGDLGGCAGFAYGISDFGQVAGLSNRSGANHEILYSGGPMKHLYLFAPGLFFLLARRGSAAR